MEVFRPGATVSGRVRVRVIRDPLGSMLVMTLVDIVIVLSAVDVALLPFEFGWVKVPFIDATVPNAASVSSGRGTRDCVKLVRLPGMTDVGSMLVIVSELTMAVASAVPIAKEAVSSVLFIMLPRPDVDDVLLGTLAKVTVALLLGEPLGSKTSALVGRVVFVSSGGMSTIVAGTAFDKLMVVQGLSVVVLFIDRKAVPLLRSPDVTVAFGTSCVLTDCMIDSMLKHARDRVARTISKVNNSPRAGL